VTKILHGKVHGKRIELDDDPGLAEGQDVSVQLSFQPPEKHWGDGLRRCAGGLASDWSEEDDLVLEQIYQERKQDTRREIIE
jgi:hypothetical protein